MAAVHERFVPLARLSSLEVVSHTGRREVEVSERASLPGRGSRWVLEGARLLYALACTWLRAFECVISSLWCEAAMFLPLTYSFLRLFKKKKSPRLSTYCGQRCFVNLNQVACVRRYNPCSFTLYSANNDNNTVRPGQAQTLCDFTAKSFLKTETIQ